MRVEKISGEELEILTGLTDRRHRQLAKEGYFLPPVRGQYEMLTTLKGLFAYYRARGDRESPRGSLMEAQKKGQDLRNRLREMEVRQANGNLLARDVLDELYRVTAEPIKQALDGMPEALGVRCNPTDPEHAASVLRQWATGLRATIAKSLEASAA